MPLKKTNTKIKGTGYQYTCSRWKLEKLWEGGRVISFPFIQRLLAGNVLSLHLSKRSDTIASNWRKKKAKKTPTHIYLKPELFSHISTKTGFTRVTTILSCTRCCICGVTKQAWSNPELVETITVVLNAGWSFRQV